MGIMRNWEVARVNNGDYYFDEPGHTGLGMYVWTDGDYYLGEWQNQVRTGYAMYRYSDGSAFFGEFVQGQSSGRKGVSLYENRAIIYLDKGRDGSHLKLVVWLDDGSFKFYRTNDDGDTFGDAFEYHADTDNIMFLRYHGSDSDTIDIGTTFHTPRPLLYRFNPYFDPAPNPGSFQYSSGNDYGMVDSSGTRRGLGAIRWDNNNFYLGEYEDGYRSGWGVYRFSSYYEVAHYTKNAPDGLVVQFWDNGEVTVRIQRGGRHDESYVIDYDDGILMYGPTNDDGFLEGQGFACPDTATMVLASFSGGSIANKGQTFTSNNPNGGSSGGSRGGNLGGGNRGGVVAPAGGASSSDGLDGKGSKGSSRGSNLGGSSSGTSIPRGGNVGGGAPAAGGANDKAAKSALILAIVAFVLSFIPFVDIASIIMGFVALGKGAKAKTASKGKKIAAMVIGALAVITAVIILISTISSIVNGIQAVQQ